MLLPGITVIRQVEDARYGLDNQRQDFIRVEFYVDKHGPFVERIDKTDNWHEVRDERLNAMAAKVRV